ncbi:MAG: ATP synthase F1 subunit gamma [Candidatus Melainabacteria bacterium]|nr:ATP synthase F1 subunit gamma [Candidatus Melainabacteria bacterium]
MANLKDIRRRIKSVKSTQKITQAMRMVAAAKVRRAEQRMKGARTFTFRLQQIFSTVLGQTDLTSLSTATPNSTLSVLKPRNSANQTIGLLIITSDRGLCGGYNTNIFRQAFITIDTLLNEGKTPVLFLVGNKAITTLKKRYPTVKIAETLNQLGVEPDYRIVDAFCHQLVSAYTGNTIDSLQIITTRFKNLVTYEVENKPFLPLNVKTIAKEVETALGKLPVDDKAGSQKQVLPELLIEPSPEAVLETLLPMFLTRLLYGYLLEAIVSELASRMTAMANATDNAKKMIHTLTLQYNKARQAAITQEIMEIVGGAEALVKA